MGTTWGIVALLALGTVGLPSTEHAWTVQPLGATSTTAVAAPSPRGAGSKLPSGLVKAIRLSATGVQPSATPGKDLYVPAGQLSADNGAPDDQFGSSVAVSAGGNIAVVGAPGHSGGRMASSGAAYVFSRIGTGFRKIADLTPSDAGANDLFGSSVAVDADGGTVLIGAPTYTAADGSHPGAAYIFKKTQTGYVQVSEAHPTGGTTGDTFGSSVTIDADGTEMAVGAPGHDTASEAGRGAVYVFDVQGSTLSQAALLTPSDTNAHDAFGTSVAMNSNGNIVISGAPNHTVNGAPATGAAYIFAADGDTYAQAGELTATDSSGGDNFGGAVAVSDAGTAFLVGAPGHAANGISTSGSAYTFTGLGSTIRQTAELSANDGAAGDRFGSVVALSGDGMVALASAVQHATDGNAGAGAVYSFDAGTTNSDVGVELVSTNSISGDHFGDSLAATFDGALALVASDGRNNDTGIVSTYASTTEVTAGDASDFDSFGQSVAMDSIGNEAIVGAPVHSVNGQNQAGAVYVYMRTGASYTQSAELTAPDAAAEDNFGTSVAVSANGNVIIVGARNHTVGGKSRSGAAYIFQRSSNGYAESAELAASDGVAQDNFGASVALDDGGDVAVAGAPEHTVGSATSTGAAYVFARSGTGYGETDELTASDGKSGDQFATAVAVSGNGHTILAGAPFRSQPGSTKVGAAYLFNEQSGTYTGGTVVTGSDSVSRDEFGSAVALSNDGSIALVGARCHPFDAVTADCGPGSAYTFVQHGSVYSQSTELNPTDGVSGDVFGAVVSLSSDGGTALIGAPCHPFRADGSACGPGAGYIFSGIGSDQSQEQELNGFDTTTNDEFGAGAALSASGNVAFIGAPHYGVSLPNSGDAYSFVFSSLLPTSETLSVVDLTNPSEPTSTSTFGDHLRLTASILSGLVPPAGTVDFYDGSEVLGTQTIPTGTNTATLIVSALPAGDNIITAELEDPTGIFASSSTAPVTEVIRPAASTTTVSANPPGGSLRYGDNVTFSATVTSPAGVPDGAVIFDDGAAGQLHTSVLHGGMASFSTTGLGVGDHHIGVTYVPASEPGGPADFRSSSASTLHVRITTVPLVIKAAGTHVSYGHGVPVITPVYTGLVNGDSPASMQSQAKCLTTAGPLGRLVGVGKYPARCAGARDHNYVISFQRGTFTVTPAKLTIQPTKQTTTFDAHLPSLTWTAHFVKGNTRASLRTKPTCSTTAKRDHGGHVVSPAGMYGISCGHAADANYLIKYGRASLRVQPAAAILVYRGVGKFRQQATAYVSATIKSPLGAGISGKQLMITIGSGGIHESCTTGKSNRAGYGKCSISKLTLSAGQAKLTVAYAGDPPTKPVYYSAESNTIYVKIQ